MRSRQRRRPGRTRPAALAFVLAGTGLVLGVSGPSSASCVGPQLTVSFTTLVESGAAPATTPAAAAGDPEEPAAAPVARGSELVVSGEFFTDGCDDTGGVSVGPGCAGPQGTRGGVRPARDVALVLTQGSRTWTLGEADATGERASVRFEIRLPPDLAPGPASLTAAAPNTGTATVLLDIT